MAEAKCVKRSTGAFCACIGCNNSYRKKAEWRCSECDIHKGVLHTDCACIEPFSLHKFPKDEQLRRMWVSALKRKDYTPGKSAVICSVHFKDGRPTKDNPYPTLALGHDEKTATCRKAPRKRSFPKENLPVGATTSLEHPAPSPPPEAEHLEQVPQEEEVPHVGRCNSCSNRVGVVYRDASTQWEPPSSITDHSYANHNAVEKLTFDFAVQCTMPAFAYDILSDEEVQFFTGLVRQKFIGIVLVLQAAVSCSLPSKLTMFNQILLVLMKLRMNCLYGDLAHRFSMSAAQVGKIFRFWIPRMSAHMKELVVWLPRETIYFSLPQQFKDSYPRTTCIIDCSEVFIDRPRKMRARAATYSNYKHHNTMKFLVAASPSGVIMYVSQCWGGRTSDKFLVNASQLYGFLEYGDEVMADRGFTIEQELATRGVTLNIPSFTRGKRQLSEQDVTKTRRIASVRIEVERVIGKLKKFRILRGTIPTCYHKLVDHFVVICAALCNLQPSITKRMGSPQGDTQAM